MIIKAAVALLNAFFIVSVGVAAPVVSISPSVKDVIEGDVFVLAVDASGVADLYAYQFDVSFNPTVLSVMGIMEGEFLATAGPTFFIPGTIDNAAGTVSFTANVLEGAVVGVTGSGSLAVLQFLALGSGISPVALSNLIVLDSELNDIVASSADATVFVAQATIPEPKTGSLILLGTMITVAGHLLRRVWARRSTHSLVSASECNAEPGQFCPAESRRIVGRYGWHHEGGAR